MNEFHAAALSYSQQGIFVFPCRPRDKRPLTARGFKDATTDHEAINAFWTHHPNANLGIDLGRSGLIAVDIDGPEAIEPFRALDLPETRSVTTGRPEGGTHHWYRPPEAVTITTTILAAKLDLRGSGAYVVAPPSIHPSGARYVSNREPIATLRESDVDRIRAAAAEHALATGRPDKPAKTYATPFATNDPAHAALKAIPTELYVWLLTGQEMNRRGFMVCPLPGHQDGPEDGGSFHAYAGTGWRCFGCNASGDVFTLARELWGKPPFREVRARLVETVLRGGDHA
jgi:hypothetical protein